MTDTTTDTMNKTETIYLRVTAEQLERIDDYWHGKRLRGRGTALRALLIRGLEAIDGDEREAIEQEG